MKKILIFGLLSMAITACTTTSQTDADTTAKLGSPNPASAYCVSQGGKSTIKNEANGQVGYCHLANGEVVEEWALFRASQENCIAEEAKRLIGQSGLTQPQIQQKTQAKTVRLVQPNQAITMDFRSDRVTVVVDPKTQKVIQASCG